HWLGQAPFAHPFERTGGDAGEAEGLRRRGSSSREVSGEERAVRKSSGVLRPRPPPLLIPSQKAPLEAGLFVEQSGTDAGLIFALTEERKRTALNPPSASADARDAPAHPATGLRWDGRRGDPRRSPRRFPRSSRSCLPRCDAAPCRSWR